MLDPSLRMWKKLEYPSGSVAWPDTVCWIAMLNSFYNYLLKYLYHELIIDPTLLRNFVHYEFLKQHYLRSQMTHVGHLAVGVCMLTTLPLNISKSYCSDR